MNNLAICYKLNLNYDKAIEYLEKSIKLKEKAGCK